MHPNHLPGRASPTQKVSSMMLHPLDVPRPKDRYESDLYERGAKRDNALGLTLAILGLIISAGLLMIGLHGMGEL